MESSHESFIWDGQEEAGDGQDVLIGSGGTCNVYRQRIDRKYYIIKKLKPEKVFHPAYLAAFKKEFEVGQELEHQNIIKYLFYSHIKNQPYIILEYIDGTSLNNHYLSKNESSALEKLEKELQFHLLQLCEAIKYIHSKGIAHGDIKPDNIIVEHATGNLKLIDFGHAISVDTITDGGGTKRYLDKEQPDPFKRDVYALGVTIADIISIVGPNQTMIKIAEKCINNSYKGIGDVIEAISCSNEKKQKRKLKMLFVSFILLLLALTGIKMASENTAPTQSNVDKKINVPVQKTETYMDSSWSFQHGYSFYETLSDTLLQEGSINRSTAFELMNDIIVMNYEQWESELQERDIQPKTIEYVNATKSYNKGYYIARVKADSLLDIFNIETKK
jgi:serine/threonine protein kinase